MEEKVVDKDERDIILKKILETLVASNEKLIKQKVLLNGVKDKENNVLNANNIEQEDLNQGNLNNNIEEEHEVEVINVFEEGSQDGVDTHQEDLQQDSTLSSGDTEEVLDHDKIEEFAKHMPGFRKNSQGDVKIQKPNGSSSSSSSNWFWSRLGY